ncbi:hypothetical protein [Ilumatobacter nonamiensis]|uniref:hypothetical protein n=1 Tax=Ilumatobacter nonamiensis TaxID=467093 RepID=UPI00034B124F|nr:hypothetical protein [Ilumatobacter nonamiensis]
MNASTLSPSPDDAGVPSRLLPVSGGRGSVTATAHGVTGRLVARLIGLRPGTTRTGSLTVEQHGSTERWVRRFGTRVWSSTLRPGSSDRHLQERLGPLTMHFDTFIGCDRSTVMTLDSVHVGPVRLPLRDAVSVTGRIDGGATTVDIHVLGGSCRYDVEFGVPR